MEASGEAPFGVFVVGTDTGVGKTVVSAGLTRALARHGHRVLALKPVVSGSVPALPRGGLVSGAAASEEQGVWEDLEWLSAAGGLALPVNERSVHRFHSPAAPAFAARLEGVTLDRRALLAGVRQAMGRADFSIVEGVGGFRVPLGEGFDTADFAVWLGLPVVLVVGLRLGCINHALLTVEALAGRGLRLAGWVANAGVDPTYAWCEETIAYLEEAIGVPCGALLGDLTAGRAQGSGQLVGELAPGSAPWRAEVERKISAAAQTLQEFAATLLA